jgi:hypothetical protein
MKETNKSICEKITGYPDESKVIGILKTGIESVRFRNKIGCITYWGEPKPQRKHPTENLDLLKSKLESHPVN